jgi:hypothetical protein
MPLALIFAAMFLQPPEEREFPTDASQPYRCTVAMALDGLRGSMWRDFASGIPDDYYRIQMFDAAESSPAPVLTWSVDNRPPARPRVYGWSVGRREAEAFRDGPDYFSFGTMHYGSVTDGAISAQLFGDGVYAGTILAQRAKYTRRVHRLGGSALTLSVSYNQYPVTVARLAAASDWEAVLIDATGRELARKTVHVPSPAAAQAEFNRARAELLRQRDAFLLHPTWSRDHPCSTWIDQLDSPI